MDDKIRKAFKMMNLLERPTGNEHQDAVIKHTFDEYVKRHNIDLKVLSGLGAVTKNHDFQNAYIAEMFYLILTRKAESKGMEADIKVGSDGRGRVSYAGPRFIYEEAEPEFAKYKRQYEITRNSVERQMYLRSELFGIRLSAGGFFQIIGAAGSDIKYTEKAFYNAFILKYDLIPKSIIKMMNNRQVDPQEIDQALQRDIRAMHGMFRRESIDDTIEGSNKK